jgi:hypothetical protein
MVILSYKRKKLEEKAALEAAGIHPTNEIPDNISIACREESAGSKISTVSSTESSTVTTENSEIFLLDSVKSEKTDKMERKRRKMSKHTPAENIAATISDDGSNENQLSRKVTASPFSPCQGVVTERIFKRDIRRKLSLMYVNVMNSADFHLLYSFLNRFCSGSSTSSSCSSSSSSYSNIPTVPLRLFTKLQIPAVTHRDFDIVSLEGIDVVALFLSGIQILLPDFYMKIVEIKLKQLPGTLETRLVTKVRYCGTYVYELDTTVFAERLSKRYSFLQSQQRIASEEKKSRTSSFESILDPLKMLAEAASHALEKEIELQRCISDSEGDEEEYEHEDEEDEDHEVCTRHLLRKGKDKPSELFTQILSEMMDSREILSSSSLSSDEFDPSSPFSLFRCTKLRDPPKYFEVEGVLSFYLTEDKKISKIIFLGKKLMPSMVTASHLLVAVKQQQQEQQQQQSK